MSPKTHSASELPAWTWIVPSASAALLLLILFGVVSSSSPLALAVAGVFLVAAVFASVHHAEVIALRVGEPFGSIILAISVTVIEVALLVSIMLSAGRRRCYSAGYGLCDRDDYAQRNRGTLLDPWRCTAL